MMYIAHKTEDGEIQTLSAHLAEVANLSKEYAADEFKNLAYVIGLLHDIGKYSDKFQKRINGNNSIRVEHAICGAQECQKLFPRNFFSRLAEFCIAGHHSGLPDGGATTDDCDKPTLAGRMKRVSEAYAAYRQELSIQEPDVKRLLEDLLKEKEKSDADIVEAYAFFTRYLFSCLTDADYINTEMVFQPQNERGVRGNFEAALELLNNKMQEFRQDTRVRVARTHLQKQAEENLKQTGEIYLLNMPTGSGKTLCSIKLALQMAVEENRKKKESIKRIIYVIPYTSIIEQTADTLERIFGDELYVLQHHSNYLFEKEEREDETTAQKIKRSCENWDAPLIVTTSVQFFQSLYHYKSSRLRKLHNLADSIIIFDEIHIMPTEYLQPCIRGIGYITRYLGSKAIFMSATMPDYRKLFLRYIPENKIVELISDKSEFTCFEKCRFENMEETSLETVVDKAASYENSLIVVNKRKTARDVYRMVKGRKYHLSTYMKPKHRAEVICEIKKCLENKEKVTVVSTSLVEAGVDLDFRAVFRQLAGLDNIIQTAGRCNREGIEETGDVFVFSIAEEGRVQKDLQPRVEATKGVMHRFNEIASKESIEFYYEELFKYYDKEIQKNSIATFNSKHSLYSIPFRSYAESFKYIKDDTISIIIPCEEIKELLARLRGGDKSVLRRLQPYSVSVYSYELENLIRMGVLEKGEGAYILGNLLYYNAEVGLDLLFEEDEKYIV